MELSVPVDFNLVNSAKKEFECLYSAAHNLVCYEQLAKVTDANGDPTAVQSFWSHAQYSVLGGFVYNWCKLYGTDSKDGFWKQVTLEQKAFRDQIYQLGDCDYASWTRCRQQMTEFRNELLFHFSAFHPLTHLPDFKIAGAAITVSHQWLRELMSHYEVAMEGPVAQADYLETLRANAEKAVAPLLGG